MSPPRWHMHMHMHMHCVPWGHTHMHGAQTPQRHTMHHAEQQSPYTKAHASNNQFHLKKLGKSTRCTSILICLCCVHVCAFVCCSIAELVKQVLATDTCSPDAKPGASGTMDVRINKLYNATNAALSTCNTGSRIRVSERDLECFGDLGV